MEGGRRELQREVCAQGGRMVEQKKEYGEDAKILEELIEQEFRVDVA